MVPVHGAHLLWQATEDPSGPTAAAARPPSIRTTGSHPLATDLDRLKSDLRRAAKARRAEAAGPGAAAAVRDRLLDLLDRGLLALAPGAPVAGYWAKGDELDPLPLLESLAGRGHPVGLPVVVAPGAPLVFRRWRPGEALVPAAFGLREPAADSPEVTPELVLAPLLAFDRRGFRLGYGGGFYDRTLARLSAARPVLAIGLAYAGQEMDRVPAGDSDWRLDAVVTETEAILVGEN